MEIAFENFDENILLGLECHCDHDPGLAISFPLNEFWVDFIPRIGDLKSSVLRIGDSDKTVDLCLCRGFELKVVGQNLMAYGRPNPTANNSNNFNLVIARSSFQMTAQAGGIGIGDIRDNAQQSHEGIFFDLNVMNNYLSVQYKAGALGASMMNLEFHPWYIPVLLK